MVYVLKMEYVFKINIFGLKMMVKSGLQKIFLKCRCSTGFNFITLLSPTLLRRRIPILILYLFSGNRLKCVSCRIIVHESCSVSLNDLFTCRPSFCESVRKYREFTSIPHHWVQRKQLKVRINTNITISEVNE